MQWLVPVIPELGNLRQEDRCHVNATWVYMVNSDWTAVDALSYVEEQAEKERYREERGTREEDVVQVHRELHSAVK